MLPAATLTLVASRFLSRLTGLSLKRKLVTGWTILPFSTSQTPSRVRPVTGRSRVDRPDVPEARDEQGSLGLGNQVFERLARAFQDQAARERNRLDLGLARPVAVDGERLDDAVFDPGSFSSRQAAAPPPPNPPKPHSAAAAQGCPGLRGSNGSERSVTLSAKSFSPSGCRRRAWRGSSAPRRPSGH